MGEDPKSIWQSQNTETSAMKINMKLIEWKARELHKKMRKQLLGTFAGPLVVLFFYFFNTRAFPAERQAIGLFSALALAWSLIGLYFLNKGMWSAMMPADAGFSTGVEFCRQELERRRRLLGRVLVWSFAPALFAIGSCVLALLTVGNVDHRDFSKALPFLMLVLVWITAYFVLRLRERRTLQREIDELNQIEKA